MANKKESNFPPLFSLVKEILRPGEHMKVLKGLPFCVLMAIAGHADNRWQAFPSVEDICFELGGCCRRSVQIAITFLEEQGYLTREPREDLEKTWLYTVHLPKPPKNRLSPWQGNAAHEAQESAPRAGSCATRRRNLRPNQKNSSPSEELTTINQNGHLKHERSEADQQAIKALIDTGKVREAKAEEIVREFGATTAKTITTMVYWGLGCNEAPRLVRELGVDRVKQKINLTIAYGDGISDEKMGGYLRSCLRNLAGADKRRERRKKTMVEEPKRNAWEKSMAGRVVAAIEELSEEEMTEFVDAVKARSPSSQRPAIARATRKTLSSNPVARRVMAEWIK